MRLFGLIGFPLAHSFSKNYFTQKFAEEKIADARYENFEIKTPAEITGLIADNPGLRGLNVTIPHKKTALPYLDETDDSTAAIGAVNVIQINNNRLKGFNTDYIGFMRALAPLLEPHHKKALVLGTGGSSLAVKFALGKLGLKAQDVSRQPQDTTVISYSALDRHMMEGHTVIINTTPSGMYPNEQDAPGIPYAFLTPRHLLFDLIYNPEETMFLKRGKAAGAKTKNGYEMLKIQAEESWKIWNSF